MHPRRRHVLATLAAGAAALPTGARAAPRRVAVIGGGMAGVATAWLLDGTHDVTLFEARDVVRHPIVQRIVMAYEKAEAAAKQDAVR